MNRNEELVVHATKEMHLENIMLNKKGIHKGVPTV